MGFFIAEMSVLPREQLALFPFRRQLIRRFPNNFSHKNANRLAGGSPEIIGRTNGGVRLCQIRAPRNAAKCAAHKRSLSGRCFMLWTPVERFGKHRTN